MLYIKIENCSFVAGLNLGPEEDPAKKDFPAGRRVDYSNEPRLRLKLSAVSQR